MYIHRTITSTKQDIHEKNDGKTMLYETGKQLHFK